MIRVVVRGVGHPNIRATHRTTLMFTKDKEISLRADCVLLVGCDKALSDFPEEFKRLARSPDRTIKVRLIVGGLEEEITGYGDPGLTYTDSRDIVVRRSIYTCPRTLAVRADKAAIDISRRIIDMLRRGHRGVAEISLM